MHNVLKLCVSKQHPGSYGDNTFGEGCGDNSPCKENTLVGRTVVERTVVERTLGGRTQIFAMLALAKEPCTRQNYSACTLLSHCASKAGPGPDQQYVKWRTSVNQAMQARPCKQDGNTCACSVYGKRNAFGYLAASPNAGRAVPLKATALVSQ